MSNKFLKLKTGNWKLETNQKGFSTLEILIAFAVLTLSVTAVISVVFGNQSSATSSQTNGEAVYQAQHILEDARASSSHTNFLDIVSVPPASVSSDIYSLETKVLDISPCSKQVTANVTWKEGIRSLVSTLTTLLTDPLEAIALSNDCPGTLPASSWQNPRSDNFSDLIDPSGNDGVDVEVYRRTSTGDRIAVLTSEHSQTDKADFWVANVNNNASPVLLNTGGLDTSGNCTNDAPRVCGLHAVDVAGDYAYVANLGNGDLSGNLSSDFRNAQLQIIDISDPSNPATVSFFSLSDSAIPVAKRVDPAGSFPEGRSLFYYGGKIYLGTMETGGDEFHVINVSVPTNPVWEGSYHLGAIGHNINAIYVQDRNVGGVPKTLAFVANSVSVSTNPEVSILDVTFPGSISVVGTFNPMGTRYGLSLTVIGNRMYVGREGSSSSTNSSFHVVDISNPATPLELGTGYNFRSSLVGMVILGNLAFLATTDPNAEFKVWDIHDPNNLSQYNCNAADGNFSQLGNGIDYFEDTIYVAVRSQNAFRVIYDDQSLPLCH